MVEGWWKGWWKRHAPASAVMTSLDREWDGGAELFPVHAIGRCANWRMLIDRRITYPTSYKHIRKTTRNYKQIETYSIACRVNVAIINA